MKQSQAAQHNMAFCTDKRRPPLHYAHPINYYQPRPSTSSQESVNNYPAGPSLEDVTCWRRLTRQLAEKEAEKQSVIQGIERFKQERRENLLEKQKKERLELVLLEEKEEKERSREARIETNRYIEEALTKDYREKQADDWRKHNEIQQARFNVCKEGDIKSEMG